MNQFIDKILNNYPKLAEYSIAIASLGIIILFALIIIPFIVPVFTVVVCIGIAIVVYTYFYGNKPS